MTYYLKVYYQAKFQDPVLNGANLASNSEVCKAIVLVSGCLLKEIKKFKGALVLSDIIVIIIFMKIYQLVQNSLRGTGSLTTK
jgi:hypothetical protein